MSEGDTWLSSIHDLRRMLGAQKADDIVQRFHQDLSQRFADPEDREKLRRDAHIVTSTAGMLGFDTLSRAAAGVERACRERGALDLLLTPLMAAKLGAMETAARHAPSR